MVLSYSGQLDLMWKGIFAITPTPSIENTLLASVALIAVFVILCFRRGLDPNQAMLVLLPIVTAMTISDEIPQYIQNIFIIIPAAIIGYGIVKFFWAR